MYYKVEIVNAKYIIQTFPGNIYTIIKLKVSLLHKHWVDPIAIDERTGRYLFQPGYTGRVRPAIIKFSDLKKTKAWNKFKPITKIDRKTVFAEIL